MAERKNAPGDPPAAKPKKGSPPPFVPSTSTKKSGSKGYEWEAALADGLKLPYTANTKKFFDAWATVEGGGGANNPFNITVDYTGKSVGDFNSVGVKIFRTPLDGVQATAQFIAHNVPYIIQTLRSGDWQHAADQIGQSGWGGGGSKATYGPAIYGHFSGNTINLGDNVPSSTLSPDAKAQVSVTASTTRKQIEAGSQAYIDAGIAVSTATATAKATAHISDPWVVVNKNKQGQVISFGEAYGAAAPKNALEQGGQALTKSALSAVWNSAYANIYEQYTGKVPNAQDIYSTLTSGLTPYGLQAKLSTLKTFTASPAYKQSGPGIDAAAKQILGTNAPTDIVRKAIAENWDSATLQENLRKQPSYLKGPEYQTNLAQMKTVYQGIYGAPDQNANQSIAETAANGWTTDQFANYLRTQPQYKTSLEYQSHAVNFLDAMGLMIGSRPTLTPGAPSVVGGVPVSDASVVPGTPKPLQPVLPFTPELAGAPGLTG